MTAAELEKKLNECRSKSNSATFRSMQLAPAIDAKKLKNAIKQYAYGAKDEQVVGLADITLLGSGKEGIIFTTEYIYSSLFRHGNERKYFDTLHGIGFPIAKIVGAKKCQDNKYLELHFADGSRRQVFVTGTYQNDFLCVIQEICACNAVSRKEEAVPQEQPLKEAEATESMTKKKTESKAKKKTESKAKKTAELKATAEAERKAREEAERKAKTEAERKAKEEAERKGKEETAHITTDEHMIREWAGADAKFQRTKTPMTIVTIGHVDHGKTTLMSAIQAVLAHYGLSEGKDPVKFQVYGVGNKENGADIHGSYIEYESKSRLYKHVDLDRHPDIVKGLISDAINPDGVILVVSAKEGVNAQMHEHLLLCRQCGINSPLVFVNHCDQICDEALLELLDNEISEVLFSYEFDDDCPIIHGSALKAKEEPDTYGSCIIDLLSSMDAYFPTVQRKADYPFLMCIDDIFEIPKLGVIVSGKVEQGILHVNDSVEIVGDLPSNITVTVSEIEQHLRQKEVAIAGDNIGICLRK